MHEPIKRLNTAAAGRLVKILGLLGSDHPGERAAAAAKANELVRGAGMSWDDVVSPSLVPAAGDWRHLVAECAAARERLSDRDAGFIDKMREWRGEPSPKQLKWIGDIHARACGGVTT